MVAIPSWLAAARWTTRSTRFLLVGVVLLKMSRPGSLPTDEVPLNRASSKLTRTLCRTPRYQAFRHGDWSDGEGKGPLAVDGSSLGWSTDSRPLRTSHNTTDGVLGQLNADAAVGRIPKAFASRSRRRARGGRPILYEYSWRGASDAAYQVTVLDSSPSATPPTKGLGACRGDVGTPPSPRKTGCQSLQGLMPNDRAISDSPLLVGRRHMQVPGCLGFLGAIEPAPWTVCRYNATLGFNSSTRTGPLGESSLACICP